jgi:hypothetical protein
MAFPEAEIEAEVQQWSHRLRLWMTERGRSQRWIERELGWASGYLSQLLRPEPPHLKIKHVLAILRALDVPPPVFFASLYELPAAAPGEDLRHMTRNDLQALVRQTVRAELSRMIQGGDEPAPGPVVIAPAVEEPRR